MSQSISIDEFNKVKKKGKRRSGFRDVDPESIVAKKGSKELIKSLKKDSEQKRNKFGAKKTKANNKVYDSKWEAERATELTVLDKTGAISDLREQVPFELVVNDLLIANYIADFVYIENGYQVVEDAKGYKTPEFRLKKKLMKAIYNIDVYESRKQ